jgi:shikimate 5-dehydrogenase
MHEAAYRALGLPHAYERLETSEAELPARVEALRRGDYDGFNVTVPHKQRVLALADEVRPSAASVGAANTLVREPDGRVTAHNTDVEALAAELRALDDAAARRSAGGGAGGAQRAAPGAGAGRTGVVLGTGGAARAAIAALGKIGCRRVVVLGRGIDARRLGPGTREHALLVEAERILAANAPEPGRLATTSVVLGPLAQVWAPPREATCVVQATTCGMDGGPPGDVVAGALDWAALGDEAVALDVVYAPPETPFLARAAARGLAHANGLGMLARQGALAFELWLGVAPPLDAMLAAIQPRAPGRDAR